MAGAALLQPPKSSSALIFGALVASNPPLAKPLSAEVLLPHPKSVVAADAVGGDLMADALGTAGAGSGVAHASLEPQGSAFEKPERPAIFPWVMLTIVGAGCEGGVRAERLNAEFTFIGCELLLVGASAGEDSEKLNRSSMPELEVVFVATGGAPDAELKSPKPLEELSVR